MRIRFLYLMMLGICSQTAGIAQINNVKDKIVQVENGLSTGVIFADSGAMRLNIKDRMRFYKVPSVSIALINNGKIEWAKAY